MIYTYFQKNVLQYIACSTTRILCQNCHDLNKKKLYSGDIKSFDLVPKLRFRLVDIFISVHTKAQSTKEKKVNLQVIPYFTLSIYMKKYLSFPLTHTYLQYIGFNTYFYHVSIVPEKCRAIILDMHDVGHKSLSHRCILDK